MKLALISALILITSSSSFAEVVLKKTRSSTSVQAVLWQSLNNLKAADDESPFPSGVIKTKGKVIYVQDADAGAFCLSSVDGLLKVQYFTCTISRPDLDWTASSDSVQAVLWKALYHQKQLDEASPYGIQSPIKLLGPGQLTVEDEETALVCESKAEGLLTVQRYRCSIKQAKN